MVDMAECAIAFPPYVKVDGEMPKYLRYRIEGGCYFFTVTLLERNNTLLVDNIDLLRDSVRFCKQKQPFCIDAWVVLPEHMHCVWTLPEGDDDFSGRWKRFKTFFSKGLPKVERRSKVRIKRGERGIWQRRFWEHAIRNDQDYENHMDYLHFNPVKHGYVKYIKDWPHSTFHRYVREGVYNENWGNNGIAIIDDKFGE